MAEVVKRRGLFIIISDLYEEPEKLLHALRHLRFKKHEIILFHVLDHNELTFPYTALSEFKDLEDGTRVKVSPRAYRKAYLEAMQDFTGTLRRQCSNMLIDYQLIDTATPFDQVLAQYLARRQRLG